MTYPLAVVEYLSSHLLDAQRWSRTSMRTSRISHETARIVNALSPTPPVDARRSRRISSYADVSSASSLQPSTNDNHDTKSSPLGKRKRRNFPTSNALATTPSAPEKDTPSTSRRSPRKAPKLEEDDEPKKKPRRQPAKRIKGPNGNVTVDPPANWDIVYSTTAAMRKRLIAPVDTMGCESLAERHRSPRDQRLQTLVSLMLSSQTKDTVTAAAMQNLQQKLPGGFNLPGLLAVEAEDLNELISKVGFHNNKTKFIKSMAQILRDRHDGDIPDTIDGLVALPGVGPKMAYLCMSAAWGRDEGIGVDVHVHRITNLWGWHKTASPEATRAELEAWLPRDKWHEINHLLVGLGQTICLPVGRRCGECDLSRDGLCPSAVAGSPSKKRVKRQVQMEADEAGAKVVKDEKVDIEVDDTGVKVEADLEDDGKVEEQIFVQDGNVVEQG